MADKTVPNVNIFLHFYNSHGGNKEYQNKLNDLSSAVSAPVSFPASSSSLNTNCSWRDVLVRFNRYTPRTSVRSITESSFLLFRLTYAATYRWTSSNVTTSKKLLQLLKTCLAIFFTLSPLAPASLRTKSISLS